MKRIACLLILLAATAVWAFPPTPPGSGSGMSAADNSTTSAGTSTTTAVTPSGLHYLLTHLSALTATSWSVTSAGVATFTSIEITRGPYAQEAKLYEANTDSGDNYFALRPPAAGTGLTANQRWVVPTSPPVAGNMFDISAVSGDNASLQWLTPTGTGNPVKHTNPAILEGSSLAEGVGGGLRIPGTSLTASKAYCMNPNTGALAYADQDNATLMPAICVSDTTSSCLFSGVMRLGATVAGCTKGKPVYVSGTAGSLTCTVPGSGKYLQRVGMMIASDNETMLVMPSLDVITVP